MRRLGLLLIFLIFAGCPKDSPKGNSPGKDALPASPPAVDASPAFRPAASTLESDAIAPGPVDWERPVMTRMELERALQGDNPPPGRFVVSFDHGSWEPHDPAAGTLAFRAHGLEGLDLDPPVAFIADPPISVGSLPGPVGGSVTLQISDLVVSTAIDAAGAAAILAVEERDPLMTQYLVELGAKAESSEGATYWSATLHGVRLVRLGAREVFLEGTSRKPSR